MVPNVWPSFCLTDGPHAQLGWRGARTVSTQGSHMYPRRKWGLQGEGVGSTPTFVPTSTSASAVIPSAMVLHTYIVKCDFTLMLYEWVLHIPSV